MTLLKDVLFCLKPRCPVCQRGRLFRPGSVTVVETCDACGTKLGAHDVGDGAAVFLIFLLGFLIIPLAWMLDLALTPPIWVHAVLWGSVALGLILLILPTAKAYIVLLEYRHRPGDWKK